MDDWFAKIAAQRHLPSETIRSLEKDGFAVMDGPVPRHKMTEFADCYDRAVESAASDDVKVGSTTTRISDFVNRGAEFDELYVFPPLLEAACRVIQIPFKLSTLHARTLRPESPAQQLHVDFAGDSQGWPMLGFIFMVDEFTAENGATCFIPGSQSAANRPELQRLVSACGPEGSMIVFNGAIWHGHGANKTRLPRRSLQGAYIRRSEESGANLPARMLPDTLGRISGLAKYLLDC